MILATMFLVLATHGLVINRSPLHLVETMHKVAHSLHLPPLLSLVGNYTGIHKDPVFESNSEIWVFNGKGATLPKYDVVFQMHLEEDWGGSWSRNWFAENRKIPVITREVTPKIPLSRRYPFEQVFDMLGVRHNSEPLQYFTSSITWALALAIYQGRPQIEIRGVDLEDSEYKEQKDCFTFWCGFAGGRGIDLNIVGCNNIFDKPLYGSYPLQQKA